MTENQEPVDLLGDPLKPLPDKRGRRKLRFAPEVYENVEALSAVGMLQDEIADAVGVSAPTLRKYFRPELGKGAARLRARMVAHLVAQSEKGKTAATKAVLAEIDKHQAAANYRRTDRAAPVPRPEAPGKKAAARADADAVVVPGTKFAPRGAVRLAAANGEAIAAPKD